MEALPEGYLQIIVVELKTSTDIEKLSKQDPFIVVNYETAEGPKKFKTTTRQDAGKKAVWGAEPKASNSVSDIHVHDFFAPVTIVAYDNETNGKHRELGLVHADYASLCINGGTDQWFKLWIGNNSNGKVRISSIFQAEQPQHEVEA